VSRYARYNSHGEGHDKREVFCSAKDHLCFAACGAMILKGEFYVRDTRSVTNGNFSKIAMNLAWHMRCAPLTKRDMKRSLDDAINENAKHPTRLEAVK
jgi:hypothetical protein